MKLEGTSVLISDDSLLMRKKLKDMVIALGCTQVIEASNGQEAIHFYKHYKPQLVFMDIIMPEKTGIEATEEIMAFDAAANIIIVSSIGTNNKLKDALKAGAKDFLQKPIDQAKVQELIEHYMK
ncbi:MAG: response regulator [Cellulosilyticaceae bacterium]